MKSIEYYSTGTMPYPTKPIRPRIGSGASSADARVYAKEMDLYDAAMVVYREQKELYDKEQRSLYDEFRKDLYEEYGVTGHPKADKCFSIAWEEGHSSGYNDVAIYFSRIVELIY